MQTQTKKIELETRTRSTAAFSSQKHVNFKTFSSTTEHCLKATVP